ncbi:glucodextranase DOMON-like domain-containing protein [Bifidobacterium crudilactis]|uniref:glucodextranase DOMON-like domain-containing protein n=1 Tax=Bifidobacterium crudilactis TaxID=327277 RepID=UPI00264724AC|nr:glucodextranase DOMON-like domain-containing protein [Bifidobacterium crudilactis]MDN6209108.1 family 49 glycosyl hydrolase [Bifidobacterium crudilactis]
MHAQWGKLTRHRSSSRRSLIALTAIGAALMMLGSSVITATAAEPTAGSTTQKNVAAKSATQVADTESLHTWWHDNAKKTSDSIADDTVRESPFYTTQVASASSPDESYKSFTYMSVPRNGNGKIGYTEQDGAEFSSEAGMSMSWSTFEYSADAYVDVTLDTGQTISSADQVTIRPTSDNFEKTLIGDNTVRIKVPYSDAGYRFSVEFDPQLITSYNDNSGGSGALTTDAASGQAVSTEPRNAMLVFAQPLLTGGSASQHIPDANASNVKHVTQKDMSGLDTVDSSIDTLYFDPGTYWMGSKYRAQLPKNIKWVYLAPGAYVKGAFEFLSTGDSFKVTGYGVLSGEQYVYEADTADNYNHLSADKSDCHSSCVKMLQFESTGSPQTLDLQGVTVASPPYHTFVMYGDEDGPFAMTVNNYQQIGGWYWQTDGLEMYKGSTLRNSFFHSNDDVIKLYHSNVKVDNTVIWKNENGPVFQWGWTSRNVDNVAVSNTDVIHNRMYWNDQKYNTCVFNSSSSYLDMGATNTADTGKNFSNLTFTNTNVEGMVNCGIRIFAMQNTQSITINGFHVDSWNKLNQSAQESLFKAFTDSDGKPVSIGNQSTDRKGLLLHNYTVGGTSIIKSGDNWSSTELGRLNFDAGLWDNWDATADGQATGDAPTLELSGINDGETAATRDLPVSGKSNAASVRISVNDGDYSEVPVTNGAFSTTVNLPNVSNTVRVTAVGDNQVMTVKRYKVYAFGTLVGSLNDPKGDDNGPGSYVYPSDSAFNKGSFDLRTFSVYRDGGNIRFVTTVDGGITNAWGGNGMSTQRLNIYLEKASSSKARSTAAATAELPGTNTFTEGAWQKAIVADGRNNGARYGSGVYETGNEPSKSADVDLSVVQGNAIVASVPSDALTGIDLGNTGYQVAIFSSAEDSEGIGNVRPVFSKDCWDGLNSCPSFVHNYRFGGGLGNVADTPAHDSVTTDSNAIDIISGSQSQADLMSLKKQQVVLPFVTFAQQDTDNPGGEDGGNGTTPGGKDQGGSTASQNASGTTDKHQPAQKVLASTGVSMASVIAVTLLLLAAGGIAYSMHHKNEN